MDVDRRSRLAAMMPRARMAYDAAKAEASRLETEKQRLEKELVDAMLDAKVKSFQIDGGMTISLRKRFDCSVNKDNNDLVQDWLTETYGDVAPFQKLVLYKPAVVAHLKKLAEAEQLDETTIPQFLNRRARTSGPSDSADLFEWLGACRTCKLRPCCSFLSEPRRPQKWKADELRRAA